MLFSSSEVRAPVASEVKMIPLTRPLLRGAFLMLLILITGIGAATDALLEPAQQWLANAPHTLQVVERKIRPIERWMHRLEGLSHRAGEMGGGKFVGVSCIQ